MDAVPLLRIPPITTVILACAAASVVLVTFDVIDSLHMIYSPTLVFEQKQYWRLITTFFYFGKVGIHSVLEIRWIYIVSSAIEEQYFHRRAWDYGFTLLIGCGLILLMRTISIIDVPFLSFVMVNMMVYLFSRLIPDQRAIIFPFIEVPMRMLPIAFLGMTVAFQGFNEAKADIVGSFAGHTIWYLLEVFPRITGLRPMQVQELFGRMVIADDGAPNDPQ